MKIPKTIPLLLFGLSACAPPPLPPEAFGVFDGPDDSLFEHRINMSSEKVAYVVVSRLGTRVSTLTCLSDLGSGLKQKMSLDLSCAGELIPFAFEWRPLTNDWVVQEDKADPLIFRAR